MTLFVGILLLILGLVALGAWAEVLLPFFQGVVVLSLLGWGVLCIVIGLSTLKAKREFARGLNDSPAEAEKSSEGE